jgi:hypothetical protein
MAVTSFGPDTTASINEQSKNIAMGFGFTAPSGTGFSALISNTTCVRDGEHGPWMGEVDIGSAGKFGVSLNASCTTGRQTPKSGVQTRAADRDQDDKEYYLSFTAYCGNH